MCKAAAICLRCTYSLLSRNGSPTCGLGMRLPTQQKSSTMKYTQKSIYIFDKVLVIIEEQKYWHLNYSKIITWKTFEEDIVE
jgi:hypothetical protein